VFEGTDETVFQQTIFTRTESIIMRPFELANPAREARDL
jgi:hypothetical protein